MPLTATLVDNNVESGISQIKEASNDDKKCDNLGERGTITNKQILCAKEKDKSCMIIIELGNSDEEDIENNECVSKSKSDSQYNDLAGQNKGKIVKNQLGDRNEDIANNELADKSEGCSKDNKGRSETNNKQTLFGGEKDKSRKIIVELGNSDEEDIENNECVSKSKSDSQYNDLAGQNKGKIVKNQLGDKNEDIANNELADKSEGCSKDNKGRSETNNKQTLFGGEKDKSCKIIVELGNSDEEDIENNECVSKSKSDSQYNDLAGQNKGKIVKNQLGDKNEDIANNELADKSEGCSKDNKGRSETNNKQTLFGGEKEKSRKIIVELGNSDEEDIENNECVSKSKSDSQYNDLAGQNKGKIVKNQLGDKNEDIANNELADKSEGCSKDNKGRSETNNKQTLFGGEKDKSCKIIVELGNSDEEDIENNECVSKSKSDSQYNDLAGQNKGKIVKNQLGDKNEDIANNELADKSEGCSKDNKGRSETNNKQTLFGGEKDKSRKIIVELGNSDEEDIENNECVSKSKSDSQYNDLAGQNKGKIVKNQLGDKNEDIANNELADKSEGCSKDNKGRSETNSKQTLFGGEKDKSREIIVELENSDEDDIENNELVSKNEGDSEHNDLADENKDKTKENQLGDKNEGCSKENKETSETINKQTKENQKETETDEDIDIIEIIDCNERNKESEGLNKKNVTTKNTSQNRNCVKKENNKINSSMETSNMHREDNEIIELDDIEDNNSPLEQEVIEIEDEGDDDELYRNIIEPQSSEYDSGDSSDEGIVVVFDRKENAVSNKKITDCGNQIGKTVTNIETHFKIKRLNENISAQEKQLLQEKMFCEKDKIWKDMYSCFMFDDRWFYTCHLCNVRGLRWWHLLPHIQNERHNKEKENKGRNIGHQVFENMPVCQIDNELSTIDKPLVGLEYLLEYVIPPGKPTDHEVVTVCGYHCALCDATKFNRRTILAHLTSFQHNNTFLKNFFPTAYMKIQLYVACKSELVRVKFLEHVIGRIEYIHGRLQPSQVYKKVFHEKKNMLKQKIEESKIHFWETPQQNFADCVDEAHIDSAQCKVGWVTRQINNPNVETYQPIFKLSSNFIDIIGSGTKMNNQDSTLTSDSNRPDPKSSAQIVQPVKPFNHDQNLQKANSSKNFDVLFNSVILFDEEEKSFYEKLVASQDSTAWERYKQRIERIESDIIKDIDYYHEHPEKHPQYQREFNNFLIKGGKGKNKNRFPANNEFMPFWKNILTDIFQDVFKIQKTKVRKEFLDVCRSKNIHQIQSTSLQHPSSPPQCSDVGINNLQHKGGPYKRSYFPTKYDNMTCKRNKVNSEPLSTIIQQPEDKTRIISVLRYVAVLESHLGSLGFKVLNLLSKALSLRKSDDVTNILLAQQENIILLCTVKEKLTGILEANILEKSLIAVAENAIKKIDTLLSSSRSVTNTDKNDCVTETSSCSDRLSNDGRGDKDCLKITEISNFIKRHDKLSHLKYLEKAAIAQQVGSHMIVQNKLEISDKDLMVLVYDTAKVLNLPLVDNETHSDNKSLENFVSYSRLDYNQSDSNISGRANYTKYPMNQSTSYNSSHNYQDYQRNTHSLSSPSRGSRFGASSSNTGSPQGYSRHLLPTPYSRSFRSENIPGYVPGYIPPQRNFHRHSLPWSHNNFK